MTPQIKQRIDQIRRGEVPEGYKKMKSDIIPEEWTSYLLSDIYTERKESGIPSLPILTVSIHSGVSDGALDDDELGKKVKRIEDKTQYRTAHSGDLVFNMMRAWQGAIGVVRSDGLVSPAYIVATPDKSAIYPPFMDYYMKTPQMVNRIHRKSYGVTDFRLRLYWDSFAMIGCAIPPLPEQKKIAEILSAQDKLIALKEKLIEEKKRRKKYLMQQLLTGKKRLPGFSGEWIDVKLGDVFSERVETNNQNLELLSVTGTNGVVPRSTIDIKDNSSEDKSKYLKICKGDIGYNTMRMWQGVSALSNYEGIVSPAYTILIPDEKISSEFFAYLFKMHTVIFLFYRFSQGIVDDTRSLKYYEFAKLHLTIPAGKEEQEAIAKILTVANKELDLLKRDLDQEKQKKKALMQHLLSGVVRVNV